MIRGRPQMAHKMRMVPLIVMVPPTVKEYLQKTAETRAITTAAVVREILGHYYETR